MTSRLPNIASSPPPATSTTTTPAEHQRETFIAQYTTRDLILYALGIGCTPSCQEELSYLYENHFDFHAHPLFPLSLLFRARRYSDPPSLGLSEFPPPLLLSSLPSSAVDGEDNAGPILHLSQSLRLHSATPVPLENDDSSGDALQSITFSSPRIISMASHRRGTLVTSEITAFLPSPQNKLLLTSQMTSLVMGRELPHYKEYNPDTLHLAPLSLLKKSPPAPMKCKKTIIAIPPHQALLYRLSGDYNTIHVEDDNEERAKPILHGLCTLGYAIRCVLQYWRHKRNVSQGRDYVVTYINCDFVKIVRVGDILEIVVWEEDVERRYSGEEGKGFVRFEVRNDGGDVLVRNGLVEMSASYHNVRCKL